MVHPDGEQRGADVESRAPDILVAAARPRQGRGIPIAEDIAAA